MNLPTTGTNTMSSSLYETSSQTNHNHFSHLSDTLRRSKFVGCLSFFSFFSFFSFSSFFDIAFEFFSQ